MASKPPQLRFGAESRTGDAGSVTLIIKTALSSWAVAIAYVRPAMSKTSKPHNPVRRSRPSEPASMAETGAGLEGSVTSITWKPPLPDTAA